MVAHIHMNILKNTELYNLNGWIVGYMDYISKKMLQRKKEEEEEEEVGRIENRRGGEEEGGGGRGEGEEGKGEGEEMEEEEKEEGEVENKRKICSHSVNSSHFLSLVGGGEGGKKDISCPARQMH